MAYGDIGGAVTELVLTCRTPATGTVAIEKGDALTLVGPYTVSNNFSLEDPVFGQAMASANANDAAIPVKVRGVCIFRYSGTAPSLDGRTGVVGSPQAGNVQAPTSGYGTGLVLKVDNTSARVHVLL